MDRKNHYDFWKSQQDKEDIYYRYRMNVERIREQLQTKETLEEAAAAAAEIEKEIKKIFR
ncbi:MAG: hypothetical protein IJD40_05560 [Lachnospiraceae bacterium]|nr:hypothetical protein [Lachnospiraceae bacterium]